MGAMGEKLRADSREKCLRGHCVSGVEVPGDCYYSPSGGHRLQDDPIGYEGGINLYGYVESAPVGKADSHGQDSWGFGISAFVGYNFSDPPGASSNQYREGFGFKATLALNGLWDPVKGRMSLNADASLWGRVSMGWGWFQFSTGFYLNHEIRLASLPAPSPLSASGG